jgi:hypothetical protein
MAWLTPFAQAVVDEFPVLRRLLDDSYGVEWVIVPAVQPQTGKPLVCLARVWPTSGFSDAVSIMDHANAHGFRCDPAGGAVWSDEGDVVSVVERLAELPAPGTRLAPHLVKGTSPGVLWTPSGS